MELLDQKNIRVSEVAPMVGYGDYRHFGEVFKKITGLTPSEYRKGK
jgi:two-component system response regulator YesN